MLGGCVTQGTQAHVLLQNMQHPSSIYHDWVFTLGGASFERIVESVYYTLSN